MLGTPGLVLDMLERYAKKDLGLLVTLAVIEGLVTSAVDADVSVATISNIVIVSSVSRVVSGSGY